MGRKTKDSRSYEDDDAGGGYSGRSAQSNPHNVIMAAAAHFKQQGMADPMQNPLVADIMSKVNLSMGQEQPLHPIALAGIVPLGGAPMPMGAASAGAQSDRIDPVIIELCSHYDIQERISRRLNNAMKKRMDTFDEDIAALWEILSEARHPAGMLQSKILEIENDDFHINAKTRAKVNKDVQKIAKKYSLDVDATIGVAEILNLRPDTKDEDLKMLEEHFENSNKPSATAMVLMKKVKNGEGLPDCSEYSRKGAGKGGRDKEDRDDREDRKRDKDDRDRRDKDDRDRGRDRDRDRDRDRKRSRSRRR